MPFVVVVIVDDEDDLQPLLRAVEEAELDAEPRVVVMPPDLAHRVVRIADEV